MARWAVAAIVLLTASAPGAGEPQGPIDSIRSELARVRSQIRANVPDNDRAALLQRLERAENALNAHRTFQALYILEAPYEGAAAFAFAASAGVRSPNDFVKKWTELGE